MEDGPSFGALRFLLFRRFLSEGCDGVGNQAGSWNERYFFPGDLSFLEQGNKSVTVRPNSRLLIKDIGFHNVFLQVNFK